MKEKELRHFILCYEISAAYWWVSWISNAWLQEQIGRYFAWKVKRKWEAFKLNEIRRQAIDATPMANVRLS